MTTNDVLELEVPCDSGGRAHSHVIKIARSSLQGFAGFPLRPGVPGERSIEYRCPVSGEERLTTFEPPAGFSWPFSVLSVS